MSGSILDMLISPRFTGSIGELFTHCGLDIVRLFGQDGKILQNVYIPKNDGTTSEIDLLFITRKGIFVIESKNYSGWIFGSESDLYWTASLYGQKNKFYNPIKQNMNHIKWLKNYLGADIKMFSMIIFSDRCEFKKVNVDSADVRVIHRFQMFHSISEIWYSSADVLGTAQINDIFSVLSSLTGADDSVRKAHIENINNKFGNTDSGMMCPRCGSVLVLRQAKNGSNAGSSFYGCSAFPKCRYTKNL